MPRCLHSLIFILSLLLVSCDTETPAQEGTKEKIMLLGNQNEPESLDPHVAKGIIEHNILRAVFEGLTVSDPKDPENSLPGAAASWEHNADFTEWTFHLQPNGKWSDGTPVTAEDFHFAYQRILSPKFGAPYVSMLYFIKGAEDYFNEKITDFSQVGVEVIAPLSLKLTLKAPCPFLLQVTRHFTWYPVPKHVVLKYGKMDERFTDWTEENNIVGNGPFRMKKWKFNHLIELEKNPFYWDAQTVQLNGLRFYPISNKSTEARMFYADQLHVTEALSAEHIKYAKRHFPDALRQEPGYGSMFLRINVTSPKLKDRNLRRALAHAMNTQSIIDYIKRGGEPLAEGLVPTLGSYTATGGIPYDVAKAKEYFSKTQYAANPAALKLNLLSSDKPESIDIAIALQAMWHDTLGIDIRIVKREWSTYLSMMDKLQYDLVSGGWYADYADPTTFLDMFRAGDGNNRTGWVNEHYDKLLEDATTITDPAQRTATLKQAERLLLDETPIVPMYWTRYNYLMHKDVKGWHPDILKSPSYKFMSLSKD